MTRFPGFRDYSTEELLELLREFARSAGHPPSRDEWSARRIYPGEMPYRRRWGSWGKALLAAGLTPQRPFPSLNCRKAVSLAHKGKRSTAWKGGKVDSCGYFALYRPGHPNASKNGYVREHRFIMSEHIGRAILDTEDVHHVNGDKRDNRIENLQLIDKGEHTRLHHKGKLKKRGNIYQSATSA